MYRSLAASPTNLLVILAVCVLLTVFSMASHANGLDSDGDNAKPATGKKRANKKTKDAGLTITQLQEKQTAELSPAEKRRLRDYNKWKIVEELVDDEMMKRQQAAVDIDGDTYAGCGHLCVHGELHWLCHKCRVVSGKKLCCKTLADRCPIGALMGQTEYLARNQQVAHWEKRVKAGHFPTFNGPLAAEKIADKLAATAVAQPPHKTMLKLVEERQAETATPKRAKKRKQEPSVESEEIPSKLARSGTHDFDDDLLTDMGTLGYQSVALRPTPDASQKRGLTLREDVTQLINQTLTEARGHWLQDDVSLDSFPQLDTPGLDAAIYDSGESSLLIQPLQFPDVRTPGVKPAVLLASAKVASTQEELAYLEELLKTSLLAASNAIDFSAYNQIAAQSRGEGKAVRKSTRARTNGADTPVADQRAINDAVSHTQFDVVKGLVTALVIVIVSRRRAVLDQTQMTREEYATLLTQPFANTASLL